MALFSVIYVRRSDGKLETFSKGRLREKNEPTKEQLDSKQNAKGSSDYYRPLTKDNPKHVDWRRKLAGMLMKEIGGQEYSPDKGYILEDLPEGFRLYEHVITKSDVDAKKALGPGAPIFERQDAYLYGHPGGRRKRFRSPSDFFPHLLWLCTDESGDAMNCSCKLCAPDEIQPDKPEKASGPIKVEKQEARPIAAVGRDPVVEIPRKATSAMPPATFSRPIAGTPAAAANPSLLQPSRNPPTRVPVQTSIDQQIDTSYGRLSFRLGEVVWFKKSENWGLGVIIRRWVHRSPTGPHERRYLVQGLSAPLLPQVPKIIEVEQDLRPWLAWSPPGYCHTGLKNLPNLTYNDADWNGIISGRFGVSSSDYVVVDGSILAAKLINTTYTPFDYLQAMPATNLPADAKIHYTTHQIMWNGIFLGGERIWVGDPVRLRSSVNEDVLVVSQIIERPNTNIPVQGQHHSPTKIIMTGNTFSLSTLASDSASPQTQHMIPPRMHEDLEARNRVLQSTIGLSRSYWKLVQTGSAVDVVDIKGRWHETSILLPIMHGQQDYASCVRSGLTDSIARSFNARPELGRSAGVRFDTREAAFGRAVPEGTKIVEGLSEPGPHELPKEPEAPAQQQFDTQMVGQYDTNMSGHGQDGSNQLVEQFLNLAETDGDPLVGFGQEYPSQNQYY